MFVLGLVSILVLSFVAYPYVMTRIEAAKNAAAIQSVAAEQVPPLFIQAYASDTTVNDRYNDFMRLLTLAWSEYERTGKQRPVLSLSDINAPLIRRQQFNEKAVAFQSFHEWQIDCFAEYVRQTNEFIASKQSKPFTLHNMGNGQQAVHYSANFGSTPQRSNVFEFKP